MKVSVIVPLHNSQKYLSECIDSIIHQTLKDIEIICIDSSTDHTLEILHQYQNRDNRIRVIEDRNSSYGHKLNVGIQQAKGEYVAIVESDDYIADDMLGNLYSVADKFKLDFVKSNFEGFVDAKDRRQFCPYERVKEKDYDRVINLKEERSCMHHIGYNIWAGIYQVDFLRDNDICFHESEGASYQDIGFANLVTMMAVKTYFLRQHFYKYRMDNEMSSVKSDKKYKCVQEEFAWLKQQMERIGCVSAADTAFFGMTQLCSYYWNYLRLSGEYRGKFLEAISGEDIGLFDEGLLDCKIFDKEHILRLLKGDPASRKQEEQNEEKRKKIYEDLQYIFQLYPKIVIVCAGIYGQAVYRLMKLTGRCGSVVVCDNNVKGKVTGFDGIEIISIKEAVRENKDGYFIIANKRYDKELRDQLEGSGIYPDKIYICGNISTGIGLLEDFIKYCREEL